MANRLPGDWDLRQRVDVNLGFTDFSGRRVLEIGPASGFFTFAMEARGAEVTAIELCADYVGDIVPHIGVDMATARAERQALLDKILNSFWYGYERHRSRARVYYGDARRLPDFGHPFEIGLLSATLPHSTDALGVLMGVAQRVTARIVIVDAWKPWMQDEDAPVIRLVPDSFNRNPHTWWEFSPKFFASALGIAGFEIVATHRFDGLLRGTHPYPLYTVVADKSEKTSR